ncbi:3-oxoacyl-[acyl-carrier-protein] reductase, partial [Mesorhizobium sp. M0684]
MTALSALADKIGLTLRGLLEGCGMVFMLRRLTIPPQKIAEMSQFLISEAGRNISGQSLSLCGNTE